MQNANGVVELSGGFFSPVSSPVNCSKQESLSKNEAQYASQGQLEHTVDVIGQDAKWQQKVMSHYDYVEFC